MSKASATANPDPVGKLPFIDAHSVMVEAPPEQVWEVTAQVMRRWVEQLLPGFSTQSGVGARPLAWLLIL